MSDTATRDLSKQIVQAYFRSVRPELASMGLRIHDVDLAMQELLHLAGGSNRRTTYLRRLRELEHARRTLEVDREMRLSELALQEYDRTRPQQGTEAQILDTLQKMLPTAALSYRQALADLADETRVSHRGTAAELRETLREVLDHLAPDDAVERSPGFRFESGKTIPTMRQKVRFILKSRRLPGDAVRVAEESASVVDEYRVSAVRSAYERASISAHVTTTRGEVLNVKRYAETVLCELLEIH